MKGVIQDSIYCNTLITYEQLLIIFCGKKERGRKRVKKKLMIGG